MTANLADSIESLTAEFPAFAFTTMTTWHCGRSLVAKPRKGVRTALFIVITSDPAEMRLILQKEFKR